MTENLNPGDYWFKIKTSLKSEAGIYLSTVCRQLQLISSDGKKYSTDCAGLQSLFRIILSIHFPGAELFKQWLAKVGCKRMPEIQDPAQSIDRARENRLKPGRSYKRIQQSLMC